ncbi:MAG: hypothetical protein K2M88_05860 [Muribaculaceae bacterium]|nr:hypothetical protein [Muribaculaceae bacterium]
MKKFIKPLLAIVVMIAFGLPDLHARVPGKTYQIGDTIMMDGMIGMVYRVDETGLHGSVLSPNGLSENQIEKQNASVQKALAKAVKEGTLTEEQKKEALAFSFNLYQLPSIPEEKAKKGKVFRVDTWSESIPAGWRLPSSQDAEEIISLLTGGIGSDYKVGSIKLDKRVSEITSDPVSQSRLRLIILGGLIIGEDTDPSKVKFVQPMSRTMSKWFVVNDKFNGSESTFAVKDF